MVLLVFGQTLRFGFVNLDDNETVYQNRHVQAGLAPKEIVWAFTSLHSESASPLSTVSHMLDCQLFGLCAWGHHLSNVVLHAASTVLLFLLLWRMTSKLWPSAFVAAVFAVHPLHVQSVAWVTERKDVLSGLFFMLALAAYLGYVRRRHWLVWYLAMVLCFVLGLLAKAMVITFPFVLLLLDYWPLGRMAAPAGRKAVVHANRWWGRLPLPIRLVLEKTPLFLLMPGSAALAVWGQGEALRGNEVFSWAWRIGNALISYVSYIYQSFCPVGLAALYPRRDSLAPWTVLGALAILALISAAAWVGRRRFPWVLVGWLWYLGMLFPVIGLVPCGAESEADRFTYLPQIGLGIAVAWTAVEVCRWRPHLAWGCGAVGVFVLAVLMICAAWQTAFWRDSVTLWTRTLACTHANRDAHNGLATALGDEHGRYDEAIEECRKALEIDPEFVRAHYNLGLYLVKRGKSDAAFEHFQKVIKYEPTDPYAHVNLGAIFLSRGRFGEAIDHFRRATQPAADDELWQASSLLAWVLATCPQASLRNGTEAVEFAQKADRLSGGEEPCVLNALAAAYAETGQFPEAVATANKAIELAEQRNDQPLLGTLHRVLNLYRANKPARLRPPPAPVGPANPPAQ
jgi:protein O-mannosyl-transferase